MHARTYGRPRRDADAAYVLAYSVIMLNTDQHNSQVGGWLGFDFGVCE